MINILTLTFIIITVRSSKRDRRIHAWRFINRSSTKKQSTDLFAENRPLDQLRKYWINKYNICKAVKWRIMNS